MSKRSVRMSRHRPDALKMFSFKQKSQLGSAHAQLIRGEINYNDIPQWVRDASRELAVQDGKFSPFDTAAVLNDLTPEDEKMIDALATEHVHGENCNHE